MKIAKTTEYQVTFSVQYFRGTEGGMDSESFGKNCNTLEEALELWDLAKISHHEEDWVIVADINKVIKK